MNRLTNRKTTRSPNSFHESESLTNHRGRSFSNIEHVLNEIPSNIHQQFISTYNSENIKRRSFSRASSIVSTNRLTSNEMNTDTSHTNSLILINDRARSLSVDHRLSNQSQMSIASRTSIRYSTPRESTVFTKTDAPPVVRLLQQTHHQDPIDAIKTLIEHQRLQAILSQPEHIPTPIIVEEDISPPLMLTLNTNIGKKISNGTTKCNPTIENNRITSNSVLSTLKNSLIKHQKQRKSTKKKHRACCIII